MTARAGAPTGTAHQNLRQPMTTDRALRILQWLPGTDLARFRTMRKDYEDGIVSDQFVESNMLGLQGSKDLARIYVVRERALRMVELPWGIRPSPVPLGSCRGVLCLANDYFIILWNRLNKSYMTAPNTTIDGYSYGFGYSEAAKDFFLIKIEVESQGKGNQQLVDVFEPRRKMWTSFAATVNFGFKILEKVGAFWKGSIFWKGYRRPAEGLPAGALIGLAVKENRFFDVGLPTTNINIKSFMLGEVGNFVYGCHCDSVDCCIWVLKEVDHQVWGWNVIATFKADVNIIMRPQIYRPMCLTDESSSLVFVSTGDFTFGLGGDIVELNIPHKTKSVIRKIEEPFKFYDCMSLQATMASMPGLAPKRVGRTQRTQRVSRKRSVEIEVQIEDRGEGEKKRRHDRGRDREMKMRRESERRDKDRSERGHYEMQRMDRDRKRKDTKRKERDGHSKDNNKKQRNERDKDRSERGHHEMQRMDRDRKRQDTKRKERDGHSKDNNKKQRNDRDKERRHK